jgi:hypothetical protein
LRAAAGDHRRGAIDADDFDSGSTQNDSVWRIAAGNIEHAPDSPLIVALPQARKEGGLLVNLVRLFHMNRAEEGGEVVDAMRHAARLLIWQGKDQETPERLSMVTSAV